jgi:hypothetical protein
LHLSAVRTRHGPLEVFLDNAQAFGLRIQTVSPTFT